MHTKTMHLVIRPKWYLIGAGTLSLSIFALAGAVIWQLITSFSNGLRHGPPGARYLLGKDGHAHQQFQSLECVLRGIPQHSGDLQLNESKAACVPPFLLVCADKIAKSMGVCPKKEEKMAATATSHRQYPLEETAAYFFARYEAELAATAAAYEANLAARGRRAEAELHARAIALSGAKATSNQPRATIPHRAVA